MAREEQFGETLGEFIQSSSACRCGRGACASMLAIVLADGGRPRRRRQGWSWPRWGGRRSSTCSRMKPVDDVLERLVRQPTEAASVVPMAGRVGGQPDQGRLGTTSWSRPRIKGLPTATSNEHAIDLQDVLRHQSPGEPAPAVRGLELRMFSPTAFGACSTTWRRSAHARLRPPARTCAILEGPRRAADLSPSFVPGRAVHPRPPRIADLPPGSPPRGP